MRELTNPHTLPIKGIARTGPALAGTAPPSDSCSLDSLSYPTAAPTIATAMLAEQESVATTTRPTAVEGPSAPTKRRQTFLRRSWRRGSTNKQHPPCHPFPVTSASRQLRGGPPYINLIGCRGGVCYFLRKIYFSEVFPNTRQARPNRWTAFRPAQLTPPKTPTYQWLRTALQIIGNST